MTLIRKITGTNQKMSIDDAMTALSNMRSFTINLDKRDDFDLSQLKKSGGVLFISWRRCYAG